MHGGGSSSPFSVLSGQVPADPDEPFFILSLTEIPVGSMGEMGDGTSEPLPLLPMTEQQRFGQHCTCLDFVWPALFSNVFLFFLSPLVFQENVWTSRSHKSLCPRKRAASSQEEISP